jgi:co-chaperonin GroES (HSP10)
LSKHGFRQLLVVGDRVLIKPDRPEERTEVGLYLPQTVVEKEKVQSGRIVATGPGIPLPDPTEDEEEPWKETARRGRYIPMQAEEGDYALFLKKAAIEIKYEGDEYLVVPQAAILVLLRESDAPPA